MGEVTEGKYSISLERITPSTPLHSPPSPRVGRGGGGKVEERYAYTTRHDVGTRKHLTSPNSFSTELRSFFLT